MTAERPDYWDGYHQAMLGHDRKLNGGTEYQRGYDEGKATLLRMTESSVAKEESE